MLLLAALIAVPGPTPRYSLFRPARVAALGHVCLALRGQGLPEDHFKRGAPLGRVSSETDRPGCGRG